MELKKILKGVKIISGEKIDDTCINNIVDDSRMVKPGDLFVAVRGCAQDASKFVGSAISRGARAVVAEKDFAASRSVAKALVGDARLALNIAADNFYGHPSRKLKVIGITGTNGKTTITYLLESVIKASGYDAGVIGTINYRTKDKVVGAVNTTPGSLMLQRMLAEMVELNAKYCVMEVSSHSLGQGRVDKVLFDIGIFTNITADHLDYHRTPVNYFNAKMRLFDKLKTDGSAVLNVDDEKVASVKRSIGAKVITYGIKNKADVAAKDIRLSMDGTTFTVHASGKSFTPPPKAPDLNPGMDGAGLAPDGWKPPAFRPGSFTIRTKLIGIHNVSNILAAVAASIALNISRRAIVTGIESMEGVPGRLEAVDARHPFKVFVDFAHTEDALFNVLSLLREIAPRRIVTVFGCGGNRDRTKRPLMGKVACKYSDHVIVTSDNPRFEDPGAIIDEIEAGIRNRFSNYDIVPDRKGAISRALDFASKDDIIVIAGKGHENYQIIGDKIMPFDDRKMVLSLLEDRDVLGRRK